MLIISQLAGKQLHQDVTGKTVCRANKVKTLVSNNHNL